MREVTLLGQNVNAFDEGGRIADPQPDLIRAVAAIPGVLHSIRYTTSIPTT